MKILIVDDHALVREGLRQVLKGLDENVEVLDASHGARAFELADAHRDLDLVLLDYHLPDMNGLSVLEVLRQRHPELPVVVLSGSASPHIMAQVLAQGAAGFLTKSGMSDELLLALRLVLEGGVYVPADLSGDTLPATLPGPLQVGFAEQLPGARNRLDSPPQFTARQVEVLQHLLDGRSTKQISVALGLSDETVKTYITVILRGFNVQTRTQAVLAASRYGYTSSRPPSTFGSP